MLWSTNDTEVNQKDKSHFPYLYILHSSEMSKKNSDSSDVRIDRAL